MILRRAVFLLSSMTVMVPLLRCGDKGRNVTHSKSNLSLDQISRLKRAADFLVSLQKPDGSFTANTEENADSAIGQTGYAIRALNLIHAEIGGFDNTLEAGRRFLVQRVEKDGLWKYKPFLPADLDDTTAALAALDGTNAEQRALAEKGIAAVLRLQEPTGALRTWLVTSEMVTAMGLNANAFHITEVHPEVMGYFFGFLALWRNPRFQSQIDSAADYLAQQQQTDGSWKTTWYRSELYSVYRVVSLLAFDDSTRKRYIKNLNLAAKFISQKQHASGACGIKEERSVLDTAFCLGALTFISGSSVPQLERAAAYLQSAQRSNGAWPTESFFFLDISQRNRSKGEKIYIGNELYSTATVVESLLRYYRFSAGFN